VQLAGLVHDLGHGPFSHMFDGSFIPRTRPDLGGSYSHETMTVSLLDELLRDNEVDMTDFGLDGTDLVFIKECVLGERLFGGVEARKGRPLSKSFLYDIVNNVHDGLDVDKLDYAERDARNTGVKSGCDVERLIAESRVVKVSQRPRVAYPDKLVADVLAAFQTRFRLHHSVYQHRVVKAIELMIVDALVGADKAGVFSFRGRNRKDFSLADTVDDPVAFALAQDDVLQQIRASRLPEASGARNLVRRIDRRELYRSVGEVSVSRLPPKRALAAGGRSDYEEDEEDTTLSQAERRADISQLFDLSEERIRALLLATRAAQLVNLAADEIVVEKVRVHHGAGANNPLDRIYFYSKANLSRARILSPSKYDNICPRVFIKEAIRVFCTSLMRQRSLAVHDALLELTSSFSNAPQPFLSLHSTPPTFSAAAGT
jgi:HD superfamily phosphohydrolase